MTMRFARHWCRGYRGQLPAFLALLLGSAMAFAAADVRILIDVSGSMKQNDPNNLRVPAMRLVSELLPQGTRAGVWLFGEDSSALIEPSEVNDAWRANAREQLSSIHSRGLFTHIERAFEAATVGWESETDAGERHIVLLTDGMVDVSKAASESAASRARILGPQLQRLRALGAHIHAVTLSANVDAELMEALTATTGGLLERADDAERLQRIFLHMLEQTAAPVTVPLVDKQFDIDASVSELTLLIFRNEGESVILIAPDGTSLAAINSGADVAWRSEAGYDLITVRNPQAGTWRFEGAEDPDNRAVVVTDLGVDMDPIDGTMVGSEVADLSAWMTDHGNAVERADLLELIAAEVRIEGEGLAPTHGSMPLNRENLRFEGRLDGRALAAGDYRLTVTLDGGTFKREINRRVRFVQDPVTVQYGEEAGETSTIIVSVLADAELTDVATLSGYLAVTDAAGLLRAFPLPKSDSGQMSVRVPASAAGPHQFAPSLYFTTRHGRSLHLEPEPQAFQMTFAASGPVPVEAALTAVEPGAQTAPISWGHTAAYVVIANLLLGLGFALIWWFFLPPKVVPIPEEAAIAA